MYHPVSCSAKIHLENVRIHKIHLENVRIRKI